MVEISKEDRFRHRLVITDLAVENGVTIKDFNIHFDRPISSSIMNLRKMFINLYS